MHTPCVAKRREHLVHRAGAVARRHDERRLVAPRGPGLVVAEDQEARRVVRLVLDVGGEDRQAVELGRGLARDGGRARLARGAARRLGVARRPRTRSARGRFAFSHSWHCASDLAVREHAADLVERPRLRHRHEVLVDRARPPRRRSSAASAA